MKETMIKLLKNVKCDDKMTRKMVATIQDRCHTCKKFSATPARPGVSPPPACKFN